MGILFMIGKLGNMPVHIINIISLFLNEILGSS